MSAYDEWKLYKNDYEIEELISKQRAILNSEFCSKINCQSCKAVKLIPLILF